MEGSNILEIILKARDEASATISEMGKKVEETAKKTQSLSTTFKEAGGIITGVGIAGIGMMTDWIKNGIDAQVIIEKTNTLLKQEASVAHESFGAVQEAAKAAGERMLNLGFDAEQSSLDFAKLLGPTKDVAKANEALSVAADLARFKNISLDDATVAVTRAYEGNTKMLKALGIELPTGAKGMEVIGMMQDRLAGQADNFSHTWQGLIDRLTASFKDLKDKLGLSLLPLFESFGDKISGIISWINKLNPNVIRTVAMVTLFGTAFALVAGPILLIIGFIPAIVAGFGLVSGALLPVGLVIAAVAAAGFLLYTHWNQVTTAIKGTGPILANIQKAFETALSFVKTVVTATLTFITKFWADNGAMIMQTVKDIFEKTMTAFQAIYDFVVPIVQALWVILSVIIKLIFNYIKDHWTQIMEITKFIWDAVTGAIKASLDLITGVINIFGDLLTGRWGKLWTDVKSMVINIWNDIKAAVKDAVNSVIDSINGIINGVNGVSGKIHIAAIPTIPHFETGGYVPSTGLAVVHEGEFVLSKAMLAGKQSSPMTTYKQPITIYANVSENIDMNLLGQKIQFALRNAR